MATPIYKEPTDPTPRLTVLEPSEDDSRLAREEYLKWREADMVKRYVWSEWEWNTYRGAREVYPGEDGYDDAHPTKRAALRVRQAELKRERLRIDLQLLEIEEALLDE